MNRGRQSSEENTCKSPRAEKEFGTFQELKEGVCAEAFV
jgi:hypothetical protein